MSKPKTCAICGKKFKEGDTIISSSQGKVHKKCKEKSQEKVKPEVPTVEQGEIKVEKKKIKKGELKTVKPSGKSNKLKELSEKAVDLADEARVKIYNTEGWFDKYSEESPSGSEKDIETYVDKMLDFAINIQDEVEEENLSRETLVDTVSYVREVNKWIKTQHPNVEKFKEASKKLIKLKEVLGKIESI